MDGCGVVGCELVVSGGDAAEVLEPAEHALDEIAALVGFGVEGVMSLAGGVVGDHRQRAALDQEAADGVAVVSGVGSQAVGRLDGGDQVDGGAGVAELTGGDGQGDRPALPIDQGVDLRRASATRAAYGLGLRPPFPPAAQRWALAWVESSISSAGGPPLAANASKASRHTPLAAQRTKRL